MFGSCFRMLQSFLFKIFDHLWTILFKFARDQAVEQVTKTFNVKGKATLPCKESIDRHKAAKYAVTTTDITNGNSENG